MEEKTICDDVKTTFAEECYNRFFSGRLAEEEVLEGLKKDGMFVFRNCFNDDGWLRQVVVEIRKVVIGLGLGDHKVPSKVRGIFKLGYGFANELVFWLLRATLDGFFRRFLGSEHNLASYDTMNETDGFSKIVANPHVDVLFGSEKTESLQCLFQFKIRATGPGANDFEFVMDQNESTAGFNCFRGSHLPSVRRDLANRFPESFKTGTWELDPKNEAILPFLEKELGCPHTVVSENNCLVIFDGAMVHYAGRNTNKKCRENVLRYAVYASIQCIAEVPLADIEKRNKWLFVSMTKNGTGHRIKDPNQTVPRFRQQDDEAKNILKTSYIPKIDLVDGKIRFTEFKDPNKCFDFSAFKLTKPVLQEEIMRLSGLHFVSLSLKERQTVISEIRDERYFSPNYLGLYNQFKETLMRKRKMEETSLKI